MQQEQVNAKLPSVVQLFKTSTEVLQKNFKKFALATLPLIVVLFAYSLIASPLEPNMQEGAEFTASTVWLLPILLVLLAVSLVVQVALYKLALNTESSVKDALSAGTANMGRFFWIGFLTSLIVSGGLILLIVPGIIFVVWYGLAGIVLVDQGLRGWEALKESKRLVKGYFLAIFGRTLAAIIIMIAIFLVGALFDPKGILDDIYGAVAFLLFIPWYTIFDTEIYKSLKNLKQ